jgi:nucleoside phosphorylase
MTGGQPAGPEAAKKAVVLTALGVEYEAVSMHLKGRKEWVHPRGTIYELGRLEVAPPWMVAISETGAGNPSTALEVGRAIEYFNPDIVLFVGVAGGLKDVALGDVVAADYVYGYETGKAAAEFLSRGKGASAAYSLVQRAKAIRRRTSWSTRIGAHPPDPLPKVFVAPIAAGEKVVTSTRSTTYQFLRSSFSDAIAVELEGWGFLDGVYANGDVPAMVIRGISDLIDDKQPESDANWQPVAARHAAAFAFELLAAWGAGEVVRAKGLPLPEEWSKSQLQAATSNQWISPGGVE